jgi:hypothetical protein
VNAPQAIEIGLVGAVRACEWAGRFYVEHAWPLLAMAAVPAVVRALMALRVRQMLPPGAHEATEGFVAASRAVLMLAIAGIDLLPGTPWWQSIWPGAWTSQLSARLSGMSGRGLEWISLCVGVALIVFVLAGLLRLLTLPRLLEWGFSLTGRRPHAAKARAEAIGFTVGNLIIIPLTTLLMYAAVARAPLCLRA